MRPKLPVEGTPELSFTSAVLGKDYTQNSDQNHCLLRRLIMGIVIRTPHRCAFALAASFLVAAIQQGMWSFLPIIVWITGLLYSKTGGASEMRVAARNWVALRDKNIIPDDLILRMHSTFEDTDWFDRKIVILQPLIWIAVGIACTASRGVVTGLVVPIVGCIGGTLPYVRLIFSSSNRYFARQVIVNSIYFSMVEERYYGQGSLDWTCLASREVKWNNGRLLAMIYTLIVAIAAFLAKVTDFWVLAYIILLIVVEATVLMLSQLMGSAEDYEYLRAPRFAVLRFVLAIHILHSFTLDALLIFMSTRALITVLGSIEGIRYVVFLALMAPVIFINRFMVVNDIIRVFKYCSEYGFKIVMFRRFSEVTARTDRTLLGPVLGGFGRVVSVFDDSLANAGPGVNSDSEAALFDPEEAIRCSMDDWQSRVVVELAGADMVVFHWDGLPTPSLAWEYHQTLAIIPPCRCVIVCPSGKREEIEHWLRSNSPGGNVRMRILDEDQQYLRFALEIYDITKRFVRTDRIYTLKSNAR